MSSNATLSRVPMHRWARRAVAIIVVAWAMAAAVLLTAGKATVESRESGVRETVASPSSAALPAPDSGPVTRASVAAGLHRLLVEELALHGIGPDSIDPVILMAYGECMVDRFFDSASDETLSAIAVGDSGAEIGDHNLLEAASRTCTARLEPAQ